MYVSMAVEEDAWHFRVEVRSSCAAALSSLAQVSHLCLWVLAPACAYVCIRVTCVYVRVRACV